MPLQRHIWGPFDFSEIGLELTYNGLRTVWLQIHYIVLKPTIPLILHEVLLIAQIGLQASNLVLFLQMYVWSSFDV